VEDEIWLEHLISCLSHLTEKKKAEVLLKIENIIVEELLNEKEDTTEDLKTP